MFFFLYAWVFLQISKGILKTLQMKVRKTFLYVFFISDLIMFPDSIFLNFIMLL